VAGSLAAIPSEARLNLAVIDRAAARGGLTEAQQRELAMAEAMRAALALTG
jgi:hypothetical protein